jgi:vacuolar-type H+-ATPase subunit C/Vma6
MRAEYAPLDARARGLARHLCTRDELERWAESADPPALARALQASGRVAAPLPATPTAADIDEAVRRTAAAALATLARWAGADNPLLEAFHAEQDRRSLRALLRGAAEAAPPGVRLAALLPTPRLSAAQLADLARARSPREAALRLLVYGDPHAPALVALTATPRVDLLEVELALARVLAERWQRAAARGDAALREALRTRIDLANAQAALELAASAGEFAAPALFIAGGRDLGRDAFVAASRAGSAAGAAAALARAFAGTSLAPLFVPAPASQAQLEAAALVQRMAALRRRGRVEPLGSAPAQLYLARLDAHGRDLRRIAWGIELGVPAAALREGLVTPWS